MGMQQMSPHKHFMDYEHNKGAFSFYVVKSGLGLNMLTMWIQTKDKPYFVNHKVVN